MKRFDFVEIGSWIVAVVFVVIATLAVNALVNHCSNPHHPAPDTQHQAPDIQWRTKYVPQPAETIFHSERIPPEPVDTDEIIRQYLAEHIYRDTVFRNDTATLNAHVQFRQIREASFSRPAYLFRKQPRRSHGSISSQRMVCSCRI